MRFERGGGGGEGSGPDPIGQDRCLGILAIPGAQGGRVPSYTADKMSVKSPGPASPPSR